MALLCSSYCGLWTKTDVFVVARVASVLEIETWQLGRPFYFQPGTLLRRARNCAAIDRPKCRHHAVQKIKSRARLTASRQSFEFVDLANQRV